MALCALGITTFGVPAVAADRNRELQNEISKRSLSPEDVNSALKDEFPNSNFPYYDAVNGCSTPLGISFGWGNNKLFEGACNNHDGCYMTPGKPKGICDAVLWDEISTVCKLRNDSCFITADVYYRGVDHFGQEPYDTSQRKQEEYIKRVYAWLNRTHTFYTNRFVNTGISVSPGDRILIKANGTIGFGLFAGSGGPTGILFNSDYNYFVDVPHGRLMARFRQPGMRDLDGWVPIGEGWDQLRKITLPSSSPGVLEFLVNDNNPEDNVGAFRVEVTIDSAKK